MKNIKHKPRYADVKWRIVRLIHRFFSNIQLIYFLFDLFERYLVEQ